jgi:hypothetical protein
MNRTGRKSTTLILIAGLIFLGLSVGVTAAPITDTHTATQTTSPFTEMQSGVYVASQWWNETGNDYAINTEPGYYTDVRGSQYIIKYNVEDVHGNQYTITENSISNWTSNWSFSNLLVVILLDPDASYATWIASQENITDLWSVFWWPHAGALSGDEVFIYSSFYYSEYNSSSYYWAEYTWQDENGAVVNPNEVIPYLPAEYAWASQMNGTYEFAYKWHYSGFGYDVNEMMRSGTTEQWMQHYFSGFSVFNDTNHNGRMDLVYSEVPYDFNADGIVDWTNYELNRTASELVYDFYPDDARIGQISFPSLNDEGQIEWSAEVVDIQGNLTASPFYAVPVGGIVPMGNISEQVPEEQSQIPVSIDSLKLTFRFEATSDAAVLKIDQYVGDFRNITSGTVPTELDGLGLSLNYWSSLSSYTISGEIPVTPLTSTSSVEAPGSQPDTGVATQWVDAPSTSLQSGDVPDGLLRFTEAANLRMLVQYGGTYLSGSDGLTHEVGTVTTPSYFYSYGAETSAPSADLVYSLGSFWGQTYYYSSCYAKWDGYSITHDPVFSVFPTIGPYSANAFITGLINSAIIIGVVGAAAIIIVCARINKERT